jgi:UDP-N-acetylglucosamine--N-acetylmuramyl-(pentapeptide) pyrophosphoryl-undecaprenol N-acetylglucosamine transferase
MTVAEVSAVGLPAVYVPLPIGNGEQRLNALPVVTRAAACWSTTPI